MDYRGYRLSTLYKDAENDIIDDLKDEINYLKKKVKENKSREETIESEIDVVECENKNLRRELGKIEKELMEAKEYIKETKNIENLQVEELEIKQTIANGIIQKLKNDLKEVEQFRKENSRLVIEMKKLKTEKEVSDEKMEKEKDKLEDRIVKAESLEKDSQYQINELKITLNEYKKKEHEQNYRTELDNIMNEKEHEAKVNSEKQEIVGKVSEENNSITEKLEFMKFVAKSETLEENKAKSLFAEIYEANTFQPCESCGKTFDDQQQLKLHRKNCQRKMYIEQCASQLQAGISKQRTNLNKQIFEAKETEIHQQYSCNSNCKPSCRIFHEKHNWVKSVSEEFIKRLHKLEIDNKCGCELCGIYFETYLDLETHMKTYHQEVQSNKSVETRSEIENQTQITHSDESFEEIFINNPDTVVMKMCQNSIQDNEIL